MEQDKGPLVPWAAWAGLGRCRSRRSGADLSGTSRGARGGRVPNAAKAMSAAIGTAPVTTDVKF